MRLINLHFIDHYQLLLIVVIIAINCLQLSNCNSTLTLLPSHHNQTLTIVNQSCNNTESGTINLKTINLTVNHDDVSNNNNLTQQLNIGRTNIRNNQININVKHNYSTIDNQLNQQSEDSNNITVKQQSATIKPEKIIIRLKRARGKPKSNFDSAERSRIQGKSSGQSTIIHQQLALTINSLSLGIIMITVETLLIIKHQLNQFNL